MKIISLTKFSFFITKALKYDPLFACLNSQAKWRAQDTKKTQLKLW